MVEERRSVEIGDCDDAVGEGGEEGEGGGGGEEVEGCVVDELGGVGVRGGGGGVGGVLGGGEFGGGDCDGEWGEGEAEVGVVGDGAGVGGEGYGCVEAWGVLAMLGSMLEEGVTRDVLREKLFSLRHSLVATSREGIPQGFNEDIVVGSWHNRDVAGSGMANLGAVA